MRKKNRGKPASLRTRKRQKPKRQRQQPRDDFIGRLKGKFHIVGDIESPVVPAEAWTGDLNNLDSEPRRQS